MMLLTNTDSYLHIQCQMELIHVLEDTDIQIHLVYWYKFHRRSYQDYRIHWCLQVNTGNMSARVLTSLPVEHSGHSAWAHTISSQTWTGHWLVIDWCTSTCLNHNNQNILHLPVQFPPVTSSLNPVPQLHWKCPIKFSHWPLIHRLRNTSHSFISTMTRNILIIITI